MIFERVALGAETYIEKKMPCGYKSVLWLPYPTALFLLEMDYY